MAQASMAVDTSADRLDRPVLAPDTWLVGQLQESALKDPPWAVEQPTRGYVEMSELSYRIAEQANGDQSIDEIATAVSTALRRPVSAVDVSALIHTVLIPRGVVVDPGGRVHDGYEDVESDAPPALPPARDGRQRARGTPSAPTVRRERIVGPARLEGLAALLMWLFWPPVALTVVALGLAALAWLIGIHGLAWSVIHVLSVPILLPVTLLLTVLGAAAQGIGPMVALYSGGATIQRLRISPSLRRPGFAVDVSDDYGLSRYARLMVNVSGVHLQLVVVLLLCVVGRALGAEFLFLAAALLTLNIVRLLLPFGRPGADRLLADWLLVQHPLRYVERALGRFVSGPASPSRPLPPLKRWGRVVIGVYVLVVAIVLAIVGLVILRVVPTLLATFWVALTAYLTGMAEAFGDRDVLGFLGALFNTAILVLTTFCLVVAIVVAARGMLVRGLAWSRETSSRRIVFGIGMAVLVTLLLLAWVPVRGWGGGGSPRSLVGVPFRSLSDQSRGTLFDLFGGEPVVESTDAASGTPPIVTNDIGSGVSGPLPGQATPATGAGGSGAAAPTNNAGSDSAAPMAGTPAAKPGPIGDATPGPRNAGRGTPGAAGQGENEPTGPATAAPSGAQSGEAAPGKRPAGQATAGPGVVPAARGTAGREDGPSGPSISGPNDGPAVGPASKTTTGPAGQPASKPTNGVVVQPVNKPSSGAAGLPSTGSASGPATKPSSGSARRPVSKPSTQATRPATGPSSSQDDDASEDAQQITPRPTGP